MGNAVPFLFALLFFFPYPQPANVSSDILAPLGSSNANLTNIGSFRHSGLVSSPDFSCRCTRNNNDWDCQISLRIQRTESFCSEQFSVNTERANKYEQLYIDAGVHFFGDKKFRAELSQEYARRYKEVEITRPAQWCMYQRDHLERADAELFAKSQYPKPQTGEVPKHQVDEVPL